MEHRQPVPATLLNCDDCLRDIPRSAALTAEGSDYVSAFCGLDCYQKFVSDDLPSVPTKPVQDR